MSIRIHKILFVSLCCIIISSVYAAETNYQVGDEVPFVEGQPAPQPAPNYAWCLEKRKAVLQTVKEKVLVREGSWYYESVPPVYQSKMEKVMVEPEQKKAVLVSQPQYKTVTEEKVIHPASVEYKTIPAQYRWVEEEVEVVPSRNEQIFVPARYETYKEKILVRPARTVREEVPGCDEDGSKIDCYSSRTIPAEYDIIEKKRLVSPARTESKVIPAQKKVMRIRKVVSPARVDKVTIPAKTETISRKVMVTPAKYRYETIPPKYRTVERKVMVKPEGRKRVQIPPKYETVTRMRVIKPERLVWVLKYRGQTQQKIESCPIPANRRSSTSYSVGNNEVIEEEIDIDMGTSSNQY